MNNIKFFKKSILFEDNHLIIINKKPGELTQGDKTKDQTLGDKVKEYIKNKYNKPGNVYLGITHRLDRPTSGIIIFCKTSKSLTRLNKMFKENSIKKTYWAVVSKIKESKEIRLEDFLLKNKKWPMENKMFNKKIQNIYHEFRYRIGLKTIRFLKDKKIISVKQNLKTKLDHNDIKKSNDKN